MPLVYSSLRGALSSLATLTVLSTLSACAVPPRLDAVPKSQTEEAQIAGIPRARVWLDGDLSGFINSVILDSQREAEALHEAGKATDPMPPANLLAISGGGDAGAFTVGILLGWTARGDRPEFKAVTGVSTGALIAPFAFLGPHYDDVLRTVATTATPNNIVHKRNPLVGITSDGMASSEPLAKLLEKYVTAETLAAIAREYKRGRALEIGTTDLDAGRQVTWNMGEIASSNSPNALELFRKIMIASASIPGLVPPVLIDVDVGDKRYQEMHVDGGVINQVFLYPTLFLTELQRATGQPLNRDLHTYVIRNQRLEPEWSDTKRRTIAIATRAIWTLVQTQGINDVVRLSQIAERDKVDFNVAYIGADFDTTHTEQFDTAYMKKLYDYGYNLAFTGTLWHKALPNP
jgi:predicted acylesterase/phospholipase RssA